MLTANKLNRMINLEASINASCMTELIDELLETIDMLEHDFSRLKKFHIWVDEFRNRLKHYDAMTDVVCGLLNFSIMGAIIG